MFCSENIPVPKNAKLSFSSIRWDQHLVYHCSKSLWAICLSLLLFSSAINTASAAEQTIHQEACIAPVPDGVAWWPLDESSGSVAADIAGQPNDGQYINSPVLDVGLVDGALSFNGTDQHLQVPNHPEINFGAENFTIAGWIKGSSNQGILVNKWKSGSGYRLRLSPDSVGDSMLTLTLSGPGGQDNYVSVNGRPINLDDDQWHYIAVVVDRTSTNQSRFYIDGETVRTFTPGDFIGTLDNDLPLYIGHDGGTGDFFAGLIDELTLFNRALDQNELTAIYEADSAGQCKTASQATIHGLVWNDLDADGLQGADEPGEAGIEVALQDETDDIISVTTTSATGVYTFSVDAPQVYKVQVSAPSDREFTIQDVGTDDTIDSDFDPSTGQSKPFDVSVGDAIGNLDAGLVTAFGTIAGLVWQDENGNGLQDSGEAGRPGQILLRQDASGIVISTTTDATGAYIFIDQPAGTYTITQVFQPGMAQTAPTSPVQTISLDPGQALDDLGFGDSVQDAESCLLNPHSIDRESLELFIDNGTDNDATYGLTISGYPGFTPRGVLTATAPLGPEQPTGPLLFVPSQRDVYFSLALSARPEIVGSNAQYQIIATNQETGHSFGCSARFWQNDNLVVTLISPPLIDVPAGIPQEITYEFENTTDEVIFFQVAVSSSFTIDGETFDAIQLNDLQPAETLFDEVAVQPGESVQFTFTAELLPSCPAPDGVRASTESVSSACIPANVLAGLGQLQISLSVGGNNILVDTEFVPASTDNVSSKGLKCSGGALRTQARFTGLIHQVTSSPGIIRGKILHDEMDDGLDIGDPGIENVTVTCRCADGFEGPGELGLSVTAITKGAGEYQFHSLSITGTYVIEIEWTDAKIVGDHIVGDHDENNIDSITKRSGPIKIQDSGTMVEINAVLIARERLISLGDVNCNDMLDSVDGLWILQFDIGKRTGASRCPTGRFSSDTGIYKIACDANGDGTCGSTDALMVLQCVIGRIHPICPSIFASGNRGNSHEHLHSPGASQAAIGIMPRAITPGGTVTIPIIAEVDEVLGSATIDVTYDSSQFRIKDCQVTINAQISLGDCNEKYAENQVSLILAAFSGITGTVHLADITLEHIGTSLDSAPLTMNIRSFTDLNGNTIPYTHTDGLINIGYWMYLPAIQQ